MNKEFVTNEQAKELQTLGFNEVCLGYYRHYTDGKKELRFDNSKMRNIEAPTYSQVFRFFREKYNIYHSVSMFGYYNTPNFHYIISGSDMKNPAHMYFLVEVETYEKAEQACLDKLIEIVKNERISSINN